VDPRVGLDVMGGENVLHVPRIELLLLGCSSRILVTIWSELYELQHFILSLEAHERLQSCRQCGNYLRFEVYKAIKICSILAYGTAQHAR
jgi:hypothetical protein